MGLLVPPLPASSAVAVELTARIEAIACAGFPAKPDGTLLAAARAFAAGHSAVHDCQADAAATWFEDLWPGYRQGMAIVGVTTAADALILADCARREGLACTVDRTAHRLDGLVSWTIE